MELFDEIKVAFDKAESIVLIPHVNADGDATGSCFALAEFLRKLGKSVTVMFEEFPRLTSIVQSEFEVYEEGTETYDLVVAVDCADIGRMGRRAELFKGETLCIDHHKTNGSIAGINYVESDSAATGEMIFKLMCHIDRSLIDSKIAECIYMAISADTGCFKYSNVTVRTHEIAAELYKIGGNFAVINRKLFDTVPLKKMKLQSKIADGLEFFDDGKIAVYYLSYEEFNDNGLVLGDVEFVSSMLKTIDGVSVGAFIHERVPGECKVSMRSDELADVSEIAAKFGGGGHARAAGCTIDGYGKEITNKIVSAIEENMVSVK